MRYRMLALLLIVTLLITPFAGCAGGSSSKNPTLSADKSSEIMKTRQFVPMDEPPALCINGVKAVYEKSKGMYFFTISDEETWETLTPTLEGYTVAYLSNFTEQTKAKALGSNRGVYLLAYNDKEYMKLSVMFTTLPILSIQTMQLPAEYTYHDANEELDVVYDDEGEPIPYDPYAAPSEDLDAPIGVYDTFIELTVLDAKAQEHGYENGFTTMARSHIRGRSSRAYPKSNYKIELLENKDGVLKERDASLLGMRMDGDWNLNGMYAEPTKVRDKVAADLWLAMTADREAAGFSTGYRCEYTEVIVNGNYHGLYLLTERLDHKQLGVKDGDFMYFSEGDLGKVYREFTDLAPDDDDDTIAGYSLKFPKEMTDDINEWQVFGEFVKLIDSTGLEDFTKKAPAWINVQSLADYEIFIQTAVATDNLIQNTYYVARLQDDGSYRFDFVPWDLDQTFGNRWHGEKPLLTGENYHSSKEYHLHFWVSDKMMLRNTADFEDIVKERYAALRKTVLSDESIRTMMEEANAAIIDSGAYERNKTRWPYGGYSSIVSPMTGFMEERMAYVDTLF